ncbi:NADH-cytochrome b5 reductase 1 [Fusarium oxysporum f. sp. albedinis]|nr:NADH-cytochrome b5 reductase 1 [Fusarium oxysporum f. sp. albedinis]
MVWSPTVSALLGVFNDTELRELLTSPPGAISYVLSASSFYLDISGSTPSIFPRTTDLCSFGCPDDICSILLLDIEVIAPSPSPSPAV